MRDLMIFSSIVLFIGFGFLAIFKFSNHLICVAGYVLATLTTCLGIVYFGWMPFFGGTYSHATYFGCIVLIMGLWGRAPCSNECALKGRPEGSCPMC